MGKTSRSSQGIHFLTDEKLSEALQFIQTRFSRHRGRDTGRAKYSLLTKFFAYTGARLVEVLEVAPADFSPDMRTVALRTSRRKEATYRVLPVHPDLRFELLRYLIQTGVHKDSTENLFGLSQRAIESFYAGLGQGLGFSINSRMLRHTFAVRALMAHTPLRVVQIWLGHTTVFKTSYYLEALEVETEKEMEAVPPIGQLPFEGAERWEELPLFLEGRV